MVLKVIGKVYSRTKFLARVAKFLDIETMRTLTTSLIQCDYDYACILCYYRTAVARAGMVDEFEKKVALTIPVPVVTQTSAIDAQEEEANKNAVAYLEVSKARLSSQLEKFHNMILFDQMTFDNLNDTFPETKLDKEKHP
ncbi:ATP synthase subunit d, mitochondrial-like [Coregonus clupeaformis]|uniref:ATP synthase subunit d, mitochondrial-like n=1 Tax=Coregonus clupeaformis TaxID=59861 RepID=UPI001E1C4B7E|nr:ATP synthase subunit d, mitochondrial-like [Coregonus clupeaformis]